jgi:WD40 repeat protein
VRQVTFSPNGKVVALTTLGTAGMLGVLAYAWNSSTGFGAKYANPATYPSLAINIQFSPSGRTLAVGTHYPPYLYIYPWSDTLGFGAAYTNPAGIGNVNSLAWRPA